MKYKILLLCLLLTQGVWMQAQTFVNELNIFDTGFDPNSKKYEWAVDEGGKIIFGAGTNNIQVKWESNGTKNVSLKINDVIVFNTKVHVYDFPTSTIITDFVVAENQIWEDIKDIYEANPDLKGAPRSYISDSYYTLDRVKLDDNYSFRLEDHGKVLRYEFITPYDKENHFSVEIPVVIKSLPSILTLDNLNNPYYAGDKLKTKVTVEANGCTITEYKWYVNNINVYSDVVASRTLENTDLITESTFIHTVTSTDHDKNIRVEVIADEGIISETRYIKTGDKLVTDRNEVLLDISPMPSGYAIGEPEPRDLPDNYWESSDDIYMFYTQNNTIYTDGEDIWLNREYNGDWNVSISDNGGYLGKVKIINNGDLNGDSPVNIPVLPNTTVVLDETDKAAPFMVDNKTFSLKKGLKWFGKNSINKTIIQLPTGADNYSMTVGKPNTVFENIAFDGNNVERTAHFLYLNDNGHSSGDNRPHGWILKNVSFRNVIMKGKMLTPQGIISVDDSNGFYWDNRTRPTHWTGLGASIQFEPASQTTTRYLIDITIEESCETKNDGLNRTVGVLYNSPRHVYMENILLKQKSDGYPIWFMRSHPPTGTVNTNQASAISPEGLIFNGLITDEQVDGNYPIAKWDQIPIQLYDSRQILISMEYAYIVYYIKQGGPYYPDPSALVLHRTLPDDAIKDYAYFNRNDGYWIIREGKTRKINEQLADLAKVYTIGNTLQEDKSFFPGEKNAEMPPVNIKIVYTGTDIGDLTIPDFGEGVPVNIVPVSSVDDYIDQGYISFVFTENAVITLDANNAKEVKFHNIDFAEKAEIYVNEVGLSMPNATPGNFMNCRFLAHKEAAEELVIKVKSIEVEDPISAGFAGNSLACEGSTGSLKVYFEGTGPWELSYRKDGDSQSTTITISRSDLVNNAYELADLVAPSRYILTGVSQNGKAGTIYNNIGDVQAIPRPVVGPIQGPSEVRVGNTIQLTNGTTGGKWMVDNESIATITQQGVLTGVVAGTVEVWYVVDNPEMPSCETIVRHTVEVKDGSGPGPGPDPDPDPDPDPEWPPVIPEPDPDPDPNPDAWIAINNPGHACYTDEFFNLQFSLIYTNKPLKYAIAFTEKSKAAGFVDIKEYKDLPKGGILSIPIPAGIAPGSYSGYILLREKGSLEYKMYPFTVVIHGGVEIIKQPQSITQLKNGDKFILSVEAKGENLRYQWFYNGQKIPGATSSTYEDVYDPEKEGLYYVEVYGDCDWVQSDEVLVTGCMSAMLQKWHDVLFVEDIKQQYVRFQWYKDGKAIETDGKAIYYPEKGGLDGVYSVRAYRADGSYDQTCELMIFNSLPELKIHIKWNDVLFIYNLNDHYKRFQWFRDGQQIADDKTAYYNTDGVGGTYFVRAYESDGTFKDSPAIDFNKVVTLASVAVYPTVVEKNHYVKVVGKELDENYAGSLVEIYSLAGNKVYSRRMETSELEIPMTYGTGAYILQVTSSDGRRKTEKIIIK